MGIAFFCCCDTPPPPCKTIEFRAWGCSTSPVNGVLISATNGGTTVSGTTSSSTGTPGRLFLNVPNTGSWDWTATPPFGSHWTGASGTKFVAACGPFPLLTQRVDLGVEEGYSCVPDPCCHSAGPPYPIIVWPSLIYLNDGHGLIAMNGGGAGNPNWTGTAVRRAAKAWDCSAPFVHNPGTPDEFTTQGAVVTDADVPVFFSAGCGGVTVDFGLCRPAGPYATPYASCYTGPLPCTTSDCGRLYEDGGTDFGWDPVVPFLVGWGSSISCPPVAVTGMGSCGDGSTAFVPSGGTTGIRYDKRYPMFQVYGATVGMGLAS